MNAQMKRIATQTGDVTVDDRGRWSVEFDEHGLAKFVTALSAQPVSAGLTDDAIVALAKKHYGSLATTQEMAFARDLLSAAQQSRQPGEGTSADARDAALRSALDRMDRARSILTNGSPSPECNWGMLDTADLRAAISASREGAKRG